MISTEAIENIRNFYSKGIALSKKQEFIRLQIEKAFSLYQHYKSKRLVVQMLMKTKIDDKTISKASAYSYASSAEMLFGELRKYNKDFLRLMVVQDALEEKMKASEIGAQALKTKDYKLWKMASDIFDRAENRIIKAGGLDRDNTEAPDFSRLESNVYVIMGDDDQRKKLAEGLKTGVIDLNEEFAEFEEIIESDEK